MSWDQLLSIAKDQQQDAVDAARDRVAPEACPNDGEPLVMGPDGRLFCPADGFRP